MSESQAQPLPENVAPGPRWRVDYLLIALFFTVMAVIPLINVLGRYVFHYSLAFTEELTINLFVWLTVLGMGVAFERGGHLGMTTIVERLPRHLQRHLLVAGAILATMLFLAVDLFLLQLMYQEITLFRAKSASLGVPVWLYYGITVACTPWVFRGIWRGQRNAAATFPRGGA